MYRMNTVTSFGDAVDKHSQHSEENRTQSRASELAVCVRRGRPAALSNWAVAVVAAEAAAFPWRPLGGASTRYNRMAHPSVRDVGDGPDRIQIVRGRKHTVGVGPTRARTGPTRHDMAGTRNTPGVDYVNHYNRRRRLISGASFTVPLSVIEVRDIEDEPRASQ